jgi:Flp pilus assembly protein TadD
LRLSPDDARTHNVLAVALAELKDLPAAAAELKTALKLEPNDSLFRSNLSCVQQRREACRLIP